jgi:hypothetical protein
VLLRTALVMLNYDLLTPVFKKLKFQFNLK